jgi:hypothetical protein
MNGDSLEIMKAISDFRQESTKAISDLHSEFSGFKGSMEARVKSVEDDQQKTEKRQWIHSCIVFGAGLIHHDLGKWFNLKF